MKKTLTQAQLPIDAVLPELQQALSQHHQVILEAPPGAGKTTRVPLALLGAAWLTGKKILMLEPRRIAARSAAYRMAALLNQGVGHSVGYRMRLENKTSQHTRIEVITEGVLTRMLQHDPSLDGVGLVIFDEFHERSLDADLALSLCLKGRELFREPDDPLKLLVMSATLDAQALNKVLANAPIVRSLGRSYPVDMHYGQATKPNERIVERLLDTLRHALQQHPNSSILAFLPGQGEIQRSHEALHEWLMQQGMRDVHIHPMYGNLSLNEQQHAIAPVADGQRKVVLATNIAETSLTIEGIDVVVDSGLVREARFDPNTGMTGLHTSRISQASSTQRAGRAGRLAAGHCYRLWTEHQQSQLAAHSTPEILRADLTPLALQLLQWGVDDPQELQWLDAPPTGLWQQALSLLSDLKAIEQKNTGYVLTAHGQALASLPLHPRLAHLLICGARIRQLPTAAHLAALLSERNPLSRHSPDMHYALEVLAGKQSCPKPQQGWLQRTRQLAQQFIQQVKKLPNTQHKVGLLIPNEQLHGYLLACAYPDRIARRRHSGGYQLANGRSANFAENHALNKQTWLAVAEVSSMAGNKSDTIRTATALNENLFKQALAGLCQQHQVVQWDKQGFTAEQQQKIGALILQRQPLTQVSTELKNRTLLDFIRKQDLECLPWQAKHQQWCARVKLLRETQTGQNWPNVSKPYLLNTLEEWLTPYVDDITTLQGLKKLDLSSILNNLLSWEQQQQLAQLAPTHLSVPSGHEIAIDYNHNPPVLAVKLQEMFGCEQTPSIARGQVALMVHLLSPAGRPLQITQDLAGFWRSSYHEVKKDMKGRYPKHPWPDDPLQAVATRKTKKHCS